MPAVLVVESSATIRGAIARTCRKRGMQTITATSVAEALSLFAQGPPAAILTAFELPCLPATALIAAIKSSPAYRAIPIALLTSADAAKLHVGAYPPDCIIRKRDDLLAAVDRFLSSLSEEPGDSGDGSAGGPGRSGSSKVLHGKILLVEDSATMQALIARFLHVAGADVSVAHNGLQAVEYTGEASCDLILMDYEMPQMDGVQASAALRAKGVRVPILGLTAHEDPKLRNKLIQAGCQEVLAKPPCRRHLVERCAHYLAAACVPA